VRPSNRPRRSPTWLTRLAERQRNTVRRTRPISGFVSGGNQLIVARGYYDLEPDRDPEPELDPEHDRDPEPEPEPDRDLDPDPAPHP
jgi:hypothetical protein